MSEACGKKVTLSTKLHGHESYDVIDPILWFMPLHRRNESSV